MPTRTFTRLLAAAALLLAAIPAIAHAQEKTYTFGVCLSISGEFQESGKKALAGVKLRVDDHNQNIPPGMPKLDYIVLDDESNPDVAAANIPRFAREGVHAVVGPLSTRLVMGMREAAEKERVVIVSPTVTSGLVGKNRDWAVRLLFDDEFQGTVLARFLAERDGYQRVAVIVNDRFTYAHSVLKAFRKKFEELGGEIALVENYEWVASEDDEFDFSPILESVAAVRPDIVLLPVNSVEIAAIISQSTRMGLDLHFCGGDTWANEHVLVASGNDVEGSFYVSGMNLDSESEEMERYQYLYDHSNDPHLQQTSVLAYDAASLLMEALKKGREPEEIRDALYSIRNLRLATGTITVTPERGSEKTAFINQIQLEGGSFIPKVVAEIVP